MYVSILYFFINEIMYGNVETTINFWLQNEI